MAHSGAHLKLHAPSGLLGDIRLPSLSTRYLVWFAMRSFDQLPEPSTSSGVAVVSGLASSGGSVSTTSGFFFAISLVVASPLPRSFDQLPEPRALAFI